MRCEKFPMRSAFVERNVRAPLRHIKIPAMRTSTWPGLKRTPARPAAAKIRPQLGSPPASAVLTRGELAMVRATASAARSDCAPRTSISTTRWAPSPSATICSARERQTDFQRRAKFLIIGSTRTNGACAGSSIRQKRQSVVCRSVTINSDSVESPANGFA